MIGQNDGVRQNGDEAPSCMRWRGLAWSCGPVISRLPSRCRTAPDLVLRARRQLVAQLPPYPAW